MSAKSRFPLRPGNRPGWLAFRTDSGMTAGSGHVMRCLALAAAWNALGGRAVFILSDPDAVLEDRILKRGFAVRNSGAETGGAADAAATLKAAEDLDAAWIVLDGYRFGPDYRDALAAGASRLLIVDDGLDAVAFHDAWILNHNPWADAALYAGRTDHAPALAGADFTLLRPEFLDKRREDAAAPDRARRLLVTFGATGGCGLLEKTLEALADPLFQDMEILVAAGHLHADDPGLSRRRQASPKGLRLVSHLDDMATAMAWADMALAAAGTTTWELLYLGVPVLLTVIAENQRLLAAWAAERGAARNLGRQEDLDAAGLRDALAGLTYDQPGRQAMRRAGLACLDGQGARRVAETLLGIASRPGMRETTGAAQSAS